MPVIRSVSRSGNFKSLSKQGPRRLENGKGCKEARAGRQRRMEAAPHLSPHWGEEGRAADAAEVVTAEVNEPVFK